MNATRTSTMRPGRRAFGRFDLLIGLAAVAALVGIAIPSLDVGGCFSSRSTSVANLMTLNQAHAMYAADWNDRQFTIVRDDLSAFGGECETYFLEQDHPDVVFGTDCDGIERGLFFEGGMNCADFDLVRPINFEDGFWQGFGSFRLPHIEGFNQYVNGRAFDETFFAPEDRWSANLVADLIPQDCPFPNPDRFMEVFATSYVLSPAAMFDPQVMGFGNAGGDFVDPRDIPTGYRSPNVSTATYPAQKSRMIEHHWTQRTSHEAPGLDECLPAPPDRFAEMYPDCHPYLFNGSLRAQPYALMYDGSVRIIGTEKAVRDQERLLNQTGVGLWNRQTPLDDYYHERRYETFGTTTAASHHILTTDGIRGRDILDD